MTNLAKCLKLIENCYSLVRTSVQLADLKAKFGRSTGGDEKNIVVLEISLRWGESWNACKIAKLTLCKYVGIECVSLHDDTCGGMRNVDACMPQPHGRVIMQKLHERMGSGDLR